MPCLMAILLIVLIEWRECEESSMEGIAPAGVSLQADGTGYAFSAIHE